MPNELNEALLDVYDVLRDYGDTLKIYIETNGTVTKDEYGSIISRSESGVLEFYVYPFTQNPSQKELEKVGIRENVDCIAYLSQYEFQDKNLTIKSIDSIRAKVVHKENEYSIKEKSEYSPFGGTTLYVVLGLKRK